MTPSLMGLNDDREVKMKTRKLRKKTIIALLIVLVSATMSKATLVDSNSIVEDGIEHYIQTNKSIYDLGEDVEILYRITNSRSEVWQVTDFPPLRDILVAAKEGGNFNTVWFWSWDKTYPAGPVVFQLQPGESVELNAIWPQIDLNGSVEIEDHTQVPPGLYRISGVCHPTDISIPVNITIIPEPSSLVLLGVGFATLFGYNKTRRN